MPWFEAVVIEIQRCTHNPTPMPLAGGSRRAGRAGRATLVTDAHQTATTKPQLTAVLHVQPAALTYSTRRWLPVVMYGTTALAS
jgi:hypothetical protein